MHLEIQRAEIEDAQQLTEIAFAAKRYWKYPEAYFAIWEKELTITSGYIRDHWVYKAIIEGNTIGFFSIVEVMEDFYAGKTFVHKGFWLDHLFLIPDYIGKGIGRRVMGFINQHCIQKNVENLYIFSDPNAYGFYEKVGAVYQSESPSSIEGRNVLLFVYKIKRNP